MRSKLSNKTKIMIIAACCTASLVIITILGVYNSIKNISVVMADDYIAGVAEDVSDNVINTLSETTVDKMIESQIVKRLNSDEVSKIICDTIKGGLSENEVDNLALSIQERLVAMELDPDLLFSEQQKEYIRTQAYAVATEVLSGMTLTGSFSDSDYKALVNKVKNSILKTVDIKQLITEQGVAGADNEVIIQSVLDSAEFNQAIQDALSSNTAITEVELATLKTEVINTVKASVKNGKNGKDGKDGQQGVPGLTGADGQDGEDGKDGKTPIKGVDYFTAAEINTIENSAASIAGATVGNKLKTVNDQISTNRNTLTLLTSQVSTLKSDISKVNSKVDNMNGADMTRINSEISAINGSINTINSNAAALKSSVAVKATSFTVAGDNGTSTVVDTTNMSMSDFVDLLAGNNNKFSSTLSTYNTQLNDLSSAVGDNGELAQGIKDAQDAISGLTASQEELAGKYSTLKGSLEDGIERLQNADTLTAGQISGILDDLSSKLTLDSLTAMGLDSETATKLQTARDAIEALKTGLQENQDNLTNYWDTVSKALANVKNTDSSWKSICEAIDKLTEWQSKKQEYNAAVAIGDTATANGLRIQLSTLEDKINRLVASAGSPYTDQLQSALDDWPEGKDANGSALMNKLVEQKGAAAEALKNYLAALKGTLNDPKMEDLGITSANPTLQQILNEINNYNITSSSTPSDEDLSGLYNDMNTLSQSIDTSVVCQINALQEYLLAVLNSGDDKLADDLALKFAGVNRAIDGINSSIDLNEANRIASEAALGSSITDLSNTVDANEQTRVASDAAIKNSVDSLSATVDANEQTRANSEAAIKSSVDSLSETVNTNEQTRVNSETTIQNSIDNLSDVVATNEQTRVNSQSALSQSIAALEEKDKWIVNLTLSTNSSSQGITVSESGTGDAYIWRIEGDKLQDDKKVTFKAKNVEEGIPESDVYISYHEGTPAFVAKYTITEGFLSIEIPKTYLVDTRTIQIDSIHVQNK